MATPGAEPALVERLQDDSPRCRAVRSLAAEPLMTDSDREHGARRGYKPKDDEDMNPNFNLVGPGFSDPGHSAMAGRDFTDADVAGAPKVAVVNETLARYFFGDGARWASGSAWAARGEALDIDDRRSGPGREGGLRARSRCRFVYIPFTQANSRGMTFYVRAAVDAAALADGVRRWWGRSTPPCPSPT